MRRRQFIALVGSAVGSWPVAVRAQQAGKLPTIGFLGADPTAFSPWTNAFVARLRELGWIENRTIAIEYRWSEGRTERYAEIGICPIECRYYCHCGQRRADRTPGDHHKSNCLCGRDRPGRQWAGRESGQAGR